MMHANQQPRVFAAVVVVVVGSLPSSPSFGFVACFCRRRCGAAEHTTHGTVS